MFAEKLFCFNVLTAQEIDTHPPTPPLPSHPTLKSPGLDSLIAFVRETSVNFSERPAEAPECFVSRQTNSFGLSRPFLVQA